MMTSRQPVPPDYGYGRPAPRDFGDSKRSSFYGDISRSAYEKPPFMTASSTATYNMPIPVSQTAIRAEPGYTAEAYNAGIAGPAAITYGVPFGSYQSSQTWETSGRVSPEESTDVDFPSPLDYPLESSRGSPAGSKNKKKGHSQRRPSNRDEFDGPHQFLKRPPAEYIAEQERDLPHLPTNLVVQEQDEILNRVNDRLSQCAFDFVAKYQFPIPLTADMRPVERPEDREWTEWVYLLKRLATKRRIPARVLYNGQIKQFVTILENSLEMRHAAKHQSRPLKDDRNILQLISAGIQVAKILKDASAMDYLDRLYTNTNRIIHERSSSKTHFRC